MLRNGPGDVIAGAVSVTSRLPPPQEARHRSRDYAWSGGIRPRLGTREKPFALGDLPPRRVDGIGRVE